MGFQMVTLAGLSIGKRVARQNHTRKLGTVIDIEGHFAKIKWDDGHTSYYRPDARGKGDDLDVLKENSH